MSRTRAVAGAVGLALAISLAAIATAQTTPDDAQRKAREAQTTAKLEAVRDARRALDAERAGTRSAVDELTRTLRDDDNRVAAAARELRQVDAQIQAQLGQVEALDRDRTALEQRLQTQRQAIAALLRSAYALGRHENLRLLFAPEQVGQATRLLAYHRYFEHDRTRRIRALTADLLALAKLRDELEATRVALQQTRDARVTDVAALDAARATRQTTLAALATQLRDQTARLTALGKDEKSLLSLLAHLRDAIADIPRVLAGGEPLSALRGRVPWPVGGRVIQAFGTTGNDGRVADGVLIDAKAGTEVTAVAHGRVAYADWLKGYGLLAIIDHGDGFMSLYAHNEALLKDVGVWVDAGEPIATVGSSGGSAGAALYFELRRQGQPLDPSAWLQRKR